MQHASIFEFTVYDFSSNLSELLRVSAYRGLYHISFSYLHTKDVFKLLSGKKKLVVIFKFVVVLITDNKCSMLVKLRTYLYVMNIYILIES